MRRKGWFPKHFTILFEFEYHLHNYWEIQHPLRTVGFQEYDGDVLWCMNTNTKNIFGTSDGFVLIIREPELTINSSVVKQSVR